ncbi:hypothetical protein KCP73_23900 [Salmonella enterica subsp. enterica]|nr:hypothetical protein KCP73_23900 [Salmonella enterica subsp. enterica]
MKYGWFLSSLPSSTPNRTISKHEIARPCCHSGLKHSAGGHRSPTRALISGLSHHPGAVNPQNAGSRCSCSSRSMS